MEAGWAMNVPRADDEFRARLAASMERNKPILDRLAAAESSLPNADALGEAAFKHFEEAKRELSEWKGRAMTRRFGPPVLWFATIPLAALRWLLGGRFEL